MRGIERRLARIERATQGDQAEHEAERFRLANADWRAAGGPISFVRGRTREEAIRHEAVLRQCGMIQPLDKVVQLPLRADTEESFLRRHVLKDWTTQKRDAIRSALAAPSPPLPAGWA